VETGIDNVLALRGDPPSGETEWKATEGGLQYSTELIELIRERHPFCVGAACFPEVHPEAPDLETDLRFLREKVDAGGDLPHHPALLRQRPLLRLRRSGASGGHRRADHPGDHAGDELQADQAVHPDVRRLDPGGLRARARERADDPDAVRDLGVAYASIQCANLLARGAPGIHFYTLNKSPPTRSILAALRAARPWDRELQPV
jgi:methylenetetrahydrofolate reductase (NADPH)